MTEEIIIDGVNVAECPHRKKEVTFMNVIKCYNYGACEGVNCLYKQLKRLEQENKELRTETESFINGFCEANTIIINENKKLRSALEEIRDYLNTLTTVDSDFPNTETYLRINDNIEEVLNG